MFAFLTILAFLNVFNSAMMWLQNGDTFLFTPYLIGQYIGNMLVTHYFWISVTIGFILLGCTVFTAFRLENVEVINTINAQKRTLDKLFEAYRTNLKSHEHLEKYIEDTTLKSQEHFEMYVDDTALKSQDLKKHIDSFVINMSRVLKKQDAIVKRVERLNKTIKIVKNDLTDLKKGFQSLEAELLLPNPTITFESSPEQINGIGPRITKELEAIGITNAGDFLFADPAIIGDKTSLSQNQAERYQGIVQLLMIPNIGLSDVELLKNAGVTNKKELAAQDPFELNVKLLNASTEFTKGGKHPNYMKPDIRKVLYWVRSARL